MTDPNRERHRAEIEARAHNARVAFPPRTGPSRYDQLDPIARALVDDYDEIDLAAMLVTAQDDLAALRAVSGGYCPACGRGDCSPTADQWYAQRQRADRAEAALARIQALVAEYPAGIDTALIEEALDGTQPATWSPPPPGSTREQLPAAVLALLPGKPYLSTACDTAQACQRAADAHVVERPWLTAHAEELHARCRLNHKFTGQLCACSCHGAEETAVPAAAEATAPVHCPCGGVHFPSPDNCRWCKCHRMRATPVPAATAATDRATRLDTLARDILSTFVPTRDSTGMHVTHHQARALPHEMQAWQDALDDTQQE